MFGMMTKSGLFIFQLALALGRVVPPGPGIRAVHEICNRKKDIKHAGVVPAGRKGTEPLVQGLGILAGKISRFIDTQEIEIPGHGLADIRQVSQLFKLSSDGLSRMHVVR